MKGTTHACDESESGRGVVHRGCVTCDSLGRQRLPRSSPAHWEARSPLCLLWFHVTLGDRRGAGQHGAPSMSLVAVCRGSPVFGVMPRNSAAEASATQRTSPSASRPLRSGGLVASTLQTR